MCFPLQVLPMADSFIEALSVYFPFYKCFIRSSPMNSPAPISLWLLLFAKITVRILNLSHSSLFLLISYSLHLWFPVPLVDLFLPCHMGVQQMYSTPSQSSLQQGIERAKRKITFQFVFSKNHSITIYLLFIKKIPLKTMLVCAGENPY